MTIPVLKPGMIGVNLKGKIDPFGSLNTVLQGDTQAAHVWWVLPSGKIASTGAKFGVFYGEEDPTKYLPRRPFFLLETIDPLTSGQLAIMQAAHDEMMGSGIKRLYGLWKFGVIAALAWKNGFVEKTGLKPTNTAPAFPICSQAVAYPFWKAGVPIGKMFGKQDWSAVLPETLLAEALAVEDILTGGLLDQEKKPCFKLHLVNSKPFIS